MVRAARLQDLREEWRGRLAQARSSALLVRLVDALFDAPLLTIPRAQRLLDVTYHTARRSVDRLMEAGMAATMELHFSHEKCNGRPRHCTVVQ